MSKADYVRDQARRHRTFDHECHWPGCEAKVPPAMWGCRKHWFALPKALRDKVWRTYRPGQEVTKTPSRDYLAVAREVQEWIAAKIQSTCDHDFQGWREFDDGCGGERVCAKCGMGAMAHTLSLDI